METSAHVHKYSEIAIDRKEQKAQVEYDSYEIENNRCKEKQPSHVYTK